MSIIPMTLLPTMTSNVVSSLTPIDRQGDTSNWKDRLPSDIGIKIYQNLSNRDHASFRLISKTWRDFAKGAQENLNVSFTSKNDQISFSDHAFLRKISRLFVHIRNLAVTACDTLEDDDLSDLQNLHHLQFLKLESPAKMTDVGLSYLARLKNLHCLHLVDCQNIEDLSLKALGQSTCLETLKLIRCHKITGAGLSHLSALGKLSTLDLSESGASSDEGLECIARFAQLKFLFLADSASQRGAWKITDVGLAHLRPSMGLLALKLENCRGLTDRAIAHITSFKDIVLLSLIHCEQFTPIGLVLATSMPQLALLDLSHCNINDHEVNFKLRFRPHLQMELTGWDLPVEDARRLHNIFVANDQMTLARTSLINESLKQFGGTRDFSNPEQGKQFEAICANICNKDRDDERGSIKKVIDLLGFGSLLLHTRASNLPIQNELGPHRPTRFRQIRALPAVFWRGICWGWRQLCQLVLKARSLIGF